jgi:hypothetical protein
MKKHIKHFILILLCIVSASCNKDSFNYKPGYVGISKITTYPVITVTGGEIVTVPVGSAFTDPGATATGNVKVVTTGIVNTASIGVYLLTYKATNTDGFSAIATRSVAVYSTDAGAQANDFSGQYIRSGNIVQWTKIAPGVYTVVNPGGAAGANLTVIVFNPTGYKVYIPQQIAAGNPASSSQESSVPGVTPGTLAQYSWAISYPNYGTQLRTFVKQ